MLASARALPSASRVAMRRAMCARVAPAAAAAAAFSSSSVAAALPAAPRCCRPALSSRAFALSSSSSFLAHRSFHSSSLAAASLWGKRAAYPPPPPNPYTQLYISSEPRWEQEGVGARAKEGVKRMLAERMGLLWWMLLVGGGVSLATWYYDLSSVSELLQPNFSSNNRFPPSRPKTKLDDVRGCDEAKAEVFEVIEYLKNPSRFDRLGGRMPKGVLLLGPPGTGKTLLARAIAGEAGVPFFSATGADFEEKYVGVGAKRVRELFAEAKKVSPAIVFIDEIDTIGAKRGDFDNPKARMSLNQLLTELDGFRETSGVIVIATTNYAEKLDPALLRPGRFDRHVTVPVPDIKGRKAILDLYARKIKLDPQVDLQSIARGTPGLTGADLFQLLNSASLRASTLNKPHVTDSDLEYAKDKLLMGAERKSAVNSEDIRRHIAFYESGKTLTALLTPSADPIHKVTLLQRGSRLGQTTQQRSGNDDQTSSTYAQYVSSLDCAMGGRAAEELVYGAEGVSSAAHADLTRATQIARSMVMAYGFGDTAGLVSHAQTDFTRGVSAATKLQVDQEVQALLSQSYERVKQKLRDNSTTLHRIATELLTHEVLDAKQLKSIAEGEALPAPVAR